MKNRFAIIAGESRKNRVPKKYNESAMYRKSTKYIKYLEYNRCSITNNIYQHYYC